MDKPKCSGNFCVINRNPKYVEDCKLLDKCYYYKPVHTSPVSNTSRMEAVVDMAIEQFDVNEEDRAKLEILFNAYVTEYMKEFCKL